MRKRGAEADAGSSGGYLWGGPHGNLLGQKECSVQISIQVVVMPVCVQIFIQPKLYSSVYTYFPQLKWERQRPTD